MFAAVSKISLQSRARACPGWPQLVEPDKRAVKFDVHSIVLLVLGTKDLPPLVAQKANRLRFCSVLLSCGCCRELANQWETVGFQFFSTVDSDEQHNDLLWCQRKT
jgi:hypothetical protein